MAEPILRVRALSVPGEDGRTRLSVPDFAAARGEVIAVRGPSGAGKSTFLLALAGLVPEATGRVAWDGSDLLSRPASARARFRRERVGMVFQDPLLFEELGPAANAAIAALFSPAETRSRIRLKASDALTRLGIDPAARRTVASHSGGERQRVAVARALAADPAIILADEPTSQLDRANADRLGADLIALARDRQALLIVATHDPALIAAADRVCLVRDGVLSVERVDPRPAEAADG